MLRPEEVQSIPTYLSAQKDVAISYPHSKTLAVYSLGKTPYAYLELATQLPKLSLRADMELSKVLKERYEEVSTAIKLNPKLWISIVMSGQLSLDELKALIDHSYQIAERINLTLG